MSSDNTPRITQNIRLLMVTQDLEQSDLAAKSGIGTSQLSRLLRGQRAWSLKHMESVSAALGVSPADLFKEADELLRSRWARAMEQLDLFTHGREMELVGA